MNELRAIKVSFRKTTFRMHQRNSRRSLTEAKYSNWL